jgi:hypothetical protein
MANTIATNLLNYLGLVGSSGAHTGSLVPRAQTPQASADLWRDFQDAGKVADPDIWTKFNQAMRRPVTFDAMLQLWEEMATWDLMAAALVEIVDEATQVDANSPATVWYTCNDRDFEDELNSMLVKLDTESIVPSQVWHVAALGNHFEKLEYAPEEGVMGMSYVHPLDVRRYWLERNRKSIGFRWAGHKPDKESAFVMPNNQTPIPRVQLGAGAGQQTEELWYPWDFLHMRRMFRLRISEHGEPIFDEAEGIYKKLKMAIDQMVVHRAQVQPDRYVINIDVKDQPPAEQVKTVQRWKQALRSKLAFGQAQQTTASTTLQPPSDFQSFYNAWSLDTILWVAKPRDFQHSVEKLQGTQNIPDVYDIELLTDLFYSIIGMPRSWFSNKGGEGSSDGNAPSGKALLAQDMRFLRKIKSIRRPIVNCYTWLGYFHAVLKGKDISQLDIKANMPPIGSLEDQMKMELLKQQAEVLDILADVMDKYQLPKEAWIEIVFKKYLHLPDEIVNIFITALPGEMEPQPVESVGKNRRPAPYSYRLVRELQEAVKDNPGLASKVELLKEMTMHTDPRRVAEMTFAKHRRSAMQEGMFKMPSFKDLDLIVSSYGRNPFELKQRQAAGKKESSKFMIQPKTLMEDSTAQTPREKTDYSVHEKPQPVTESKWRKFYPNKL